MRLNVLLDNYTINIKVGFQVMRFTGVWCGVMNYDRDIDNKKPGSQSHVHFGWKTFQPIMKYSNEHYRN